MTDTWNDMEDEERMLAEEIFVALDGSAELIQSAVPSEASSGRLQFFALVAFATDPSARMTADLAQALLREPGRRRDLDALLRRDVVAHFGRVAAASSGEIELREVGAYRIRMLDSQSTDGQVYVIIELPEAASVPEMLVILRGEDDPIKEALPPAQDGQIQILTSADAPLVEGLRDISSEVVLR
jgi:hypothetical protein